MTLADFFNAVNAAGVRLANVGGQLQLRGPAGGMTPEIRAGAAEHKATLLALLPPAPVPNGQDRERAHPEEREEEREAIQWADTLTPREAAEAVDRAWAGWGWQPAPTNWEGSEMSTGKDATAPSPPDVWPADLQELIDWFETVDLPQTPFAMEPWRWITNPAQFYAALRQDVSQGPRGPRATNGALVADLRRLREVLAGAGTRSTAS